MTALTAQPESKSRLRGRERADISLSATILALNLAGVILVSVAYNGGRVQKTWADSAFWIAQLMLFVPFAYRLALQAPSRSERIGMVVLLAMELYVVKVLYSPEEYKFTDEFQHWRTVSDILESGQLFRANFMLPVSALYPGLEIATSALANLSGTNVFLSGTAVVALVRLPFSLGMYLLFEDLSNSGRVASIASLLYMTCPHYQFFDAMFSYQSIALGFAFVALYLVSSSDKGGDGARVPRRIVLYTCIGLVVMSHHITSYALLTLLATWVAVAWVGKGRGWGAYSPVGPLLITAVMTFGWLIYVGSITIGYLVNPLDSVILELTALLLGQGSATDVFRAPTGPVWERVATLAAVFTISVCLLPGAKLVFRRYYARSGALALLVVGFGYYLSLLVRFTGHGAEFTGRSWSYIFLGVAFVVATLLDYLASSRTFIPGTQPYLRLSVVAVMTVLLVGGITSGWPPYWARLPGPYLASGFERSVEPQSVLAAHWTREALGTGNRFATDFTNYTLLGAYGGQDAIRGASQLFFASGIGQAERHILITQDIEYIAVDLRLSQYLPASGRYFEPQEPGAFDHVRPIPKGSLTKFDSLIGADRLFDSGDIVIYNVDQVKYVAK